MITKRIYEMTILLIVLGMMMGCSTARQMMGGISSQALVAESLEAMPPGVLVFMGYALLVLSGAGLATLTGLYAVFGAIP